MNVNQWSQYNQQMNVNRPWYGRGATWNKPFYGGLPAWNWSRPWFNYHYGWHSGYFGAFNILPAFWSGVAVGALSSPGDNFAYANPYYAAPPSSTTIIVQAPNYSEPIPAPTVEQTVIAYPTAPEQQSVQDGEALPTGAPPPPPEDDTASSANKVFDQARVSFKAGKYADAETKVDEAIKILPSDATLHEFRSLTLFAQAKYKDAAAGLYAVLAAGPGWNWETVRALYADPAHYTKQLRALEAYAKEHPDAGYARFLLAYEYLVLNSKDAAVAQFKEVVRLQPDDKLSAALLQALTSGGSSDTPVPAK